VLGANTEIPNAAADGVKQGGEQGEEPEPEPELEPGPEPELELEPEPEPGRGAEGRRARGPCPGGGLLRGGSRPSWTRAA